MGFEQLTALKAQLNHGATSKTVASRSTSSPVDATRDIKQPPKPRHTSADAAARAINTLQRLFPRAFPRSPAPKVPLKVGILKDVLARAASLGLSERDARNGLKLWCRGQRYWTCLVEGDVRVDLTGAIAGVVTAVEAEYGAGQEKIRLARRREQIAKDRPGQPR
ncbi:MULTISPECIES: ProQ/FinO family protein [unclassified Caballeronia]|uniref:ProQ/FinO family protein n=1 Tax=unclassified Caballeronia TaxID=2646786 RepID=UPI001F2B91EB|nr:MULTISPECIES: ProQ/FinO family protein [unclassified Caballeronia]MCE4547233.1 ProQ/FinO family protein [Caballeronia sp. PC1]MCE4575215.1 ProQ/FinO family protein [Caballeronia sp. CLC5]